MVPIAPHVIGLRLDDNYCLLFQGPSYLVSISSMFPMCRPNTFVFSPPPVGYNYNEDRFLIQHSIQLYICNLGVLNREYIESYSSPNRLSGSLDPNCHQQKRTVSRDYFQVNLAKNSCHQFAKLYCLSHRIQH